MLKRLKREPAPWRGQAVVLAVSGGCDSVALLRLSRPLARDLDLTLSVAHLHHGTRGEAADADADFVQNLAASLDLPFDLGRWKPDQASAFEAWARTARYAWLAQVARERNAHAVATAHTSDDQAETILFRILRGTGPKGLAGIPSRRALTDQVSLIRPLLAASIDRLSLQTLLQNLDQPWREDATNKDVHHARARIRHNLLPSLAADYNPRVREALLRLGKLSKLLTDNLQETLDLAEAGALNRFDSSQIVLDRAASKPCLPLSALSF